VRKNVLLNSIQLNKMSAQDFGSLPATGETNFNLPNWQDGNWTNFMSNTGMGPMPIDSAKSKFVLLKY